MNYLGVAATRLRLGYKRVGKAARLDSAILWMLGVVWASLWIGGGGVLLHRQTRPSADKAQRREGGNDHVGVFSYIENGWVVKKSSAYC